MDFGNSHGFKFNLCVLAVGVHDPGGELHPLCNHCEIVTAGKLQRLSWDGLSFFVYCATIYNSILFMRLTVGNF